MTGAMRFDNLRAFLTHNLTFSIKLNRYQILAEDHGRKPVGESVPLKQMKEIV